MRPKTAIIILVILAIACTLFLVYLYKVTNSNKSVNYINYQRQETNQDSTSSEEILGKEPEKTEAEKKLEQEVNSLIEKDLADDGKIEDKTRKEIINMTTELIKNQEAGLLEEEKESQNDRQKIIDETIERIEENK